jgi:uncharacterized membrane protein YhaH (DUF805 family)
MRKMPRSKFHLSYVFGWAGIVCAILGLIAKAIDRAIGYGGDFWMFLALFLVLLAITLKVDAIRIRGEKP